MVISEIFPNPTLKQVIFQIKFPNLFYIENKIGDLQIKIMQQFPKSALLFQRQVVILDGNVKPEDVKTDNEFVKKIWQFTSEKDYTLSVTSDSLDITSKHHKTYNLEGSDKFRDVIEFVLRNFFDVTQIPIINRIGLRYTDECPLPSKDNATFASYYNSTYPISRFSIDDTEEMLFRTVVRKGDDYLIYIETLRKRDNEYKYTLDFDGYKNNIHPDQCLPVADELHKIISEEFEQTIRTPVYEYMRKKS